MAHPNGHDTEDGTGDGVRDGDKPLHVLIVGAGIGGLTAALALRRQGHHVELFEQSKLAQETGAAIHLAPNCNGLLRRLGFKAEDIGGVECVGVVEYSPEGQVRYAIDTKKMSSMWAHPWQLVHRAHLHTALKQMATGDEGEGRPAKLHVASRVTSVDPDTATITFEDGTHLQGDLLVGADGVHSRTRKAIPGGDMEPFDSGKSAYRFLVPTELLSSDPRTAEAVSRVGYLTMWIGENKRLVMYPCVSNTMMNFVAIHPSKESEQHIGGEEGWQETGSKERMLQIFADFAPNIKAIFEKVDEDKLKTWALLDMAQMPSFINGRLAALGDSAHPFLPHQGQGGGQAIEDGVALAALLPLGTRSDEITDRLQLYQECRYERAHTIQEFTRTAGKDAAELAAEGKKLDMMQYQAYNFGHDAWDFASDVLRKHLESRDSSLRFRSPYGFGPAPGPRQPLAQHPTASNIQKSRKVNTERSETYTIRFQSSRTYLQNLLPPGFAFTSPGTVCEASIICTTLDGMAWLGGKGYSHLGLYLHGINFAKKDGSKVFGTYLSVMWENLADPIITGRDELGMPKVFADIDTVQRGDGKGCSISIGWCGTAFGKFEVDNLVKEESTSGAAVPSAPPQRGPGPPPPPPEQGLFLYRYVPTVGEPGKVDAAYPVLVPKTPAAVADAAPESFVTKEATLSFDSGDWHSLPTLHHIVKSLAEMPIYSVVEARLTKAQGVDDIASAHKME